MPADKREMLHNVFEIGVKQVREIMIPRGEIISEMSLRGEDETLEWVGVARAAAGRREQRLVPDPESIPEREERTLYRGRIYIEEVQRILYGISFSVPTAAIRRFTNRSRPRLRDRGWPLPAY